MPQNLQTARGFIRADDLIVKFSNTTATDIKKTIFLQHHKEKSYRYPRQPGGVLGSVEGGNAHKAPILFSLTGGLERACSKAGFFNILSTHWKMPVLKRRFQYVPRHQALLRFTNEYFFKNRKFNSSGLKGFLDGLLCYAVVGLVPEGMDDKVNEVIEDCMGYVDEARNAESTWMCLNTRKDLEIAAKAFPEIESMSNQCLRAATTHCLPLKATKIQEGH
jgi:hypothetical protein